MRTEIRRETPKPEQPPIKEVVLTLTASEARTLRKIASVISASHLEKALTFDMDASPATTKQDAANMIGLLCSALPIIRG